MKKNFLLLSFYNILNNDDGIDAFVYIVKESKDREFILNKLIHILVYYKSFINYKDTIFYIDKLEHGDETYLEDTLNYIISSPFCKIVRYLNMDMVEIYNKYYIDFQYFTLEKYNFKNVVYTIEEIGKLFEDKFGIMRDKYLIDNEIFDDRFEKEKQMYIKRTLFVENI